MVDEYKVKGNEYNEKGRAILEESPAWHKKKRRCASGHGGIKKMEKSLSMKVLRINVRE